MGPQLSSGENATAKVLGRRQRLTWPVSPSAGCELVAPSVTCVPSPPWLSLLSLPVLPPLSSLSDSARPDAAAAAAAAVFLWSRARCCSSSRSPLRWRGINLVARCRFAVPSSCSSAAAWAAAAWPAVAAKPGCLRFDIPAPLGAWAAVSKEQGGLEAPAASCQSLLRLCCGPNPSSLRHRVIAAYLLRSAISNPLVPTALCPHGGQALLPLACCAAEVRCS